MKVEIEWNNNCYLKDIKYGDFFYYNSNIYIKCNFKTTDFPTSFSSKEITYNISIKMIEIFDNNIMVIPLEQKNTLELIEAKKIK